MRRILRRTGWRGLVAWSVLAIQGVAIVHGRFDDAAYFTWAPHDAQNEYSITVTTDAGVLTPEEVEGRYRIPARGVDPRSIAHVTRLVEQYERTLGAGDGAEAVVRYRVNGGPLREWRTARGAGVQSP